MTTLTAADQASIQQDLQDEQDRYERALDTVPLPGLEARHREYLAVKRAYIEELERLLWGEG